MTLQLLNQANPSRRGGRWSVDRSCGGFRRTLIESTQSAASGGPSEAEADATVFETIRAVSRELSAMAEAGKYTKEVRDSVFETCGPFALLSYIGRRAITRPRGYQGDFKSIDHIYANTPKGASRIGRGIDRYVLEMPAAQDVRQRRRFLAARIRDVVETQEGARIMNIASGPARELADAVALSAPVGRVTCLDGDLGSLDYARRNLLNARGDLPLECVCANVAKVVREFSDLGLGGQDLIYASGLIDYFDDRLVIALLNRMHRLLRPGGTALVGNFSPSNPDKEAMDAVLDWPLAHRSASDLRALFARSAFGADGVDVHQMDAGVQLIAEAHKE